MFPDRGCTLAVVLPCGGTVLDTIPLCFSFPFPWPCVVVVVFPPLLLIDAMQGVLHPVTPTPHLCCHVSLEFCQLPFPSNPFYCLTKARNKLLCSVSLFFSLHPPPCIIFSIHLLNALDLSSEALSDFEGARNRALVLSGLSWAYSQVK